MCQISPKVHSAEKVFTLFNFPSTSSSMGFRLIHIIASIRAKKKKRNNLSATVLLH